MRIQSSAIGAIGFSVLMLSLSNSSKAAAPSAEIVRVPATANSLAPNLCAVGDGFALCWIDRKPDKLASLRVAIWNGKSFAEARTIATSKTMFANWADIPSVTEAPLGDLYAHWLDRISNGYLWFTWTDKNRVQLGRLKLAPPR